MKKINFTWNNTDWSVSSIDNQNISHLQQNQSMNNKNSNTEQNEFQPRHIDVDALYRFEKQTEFQHGLEELLTNARHEAAALAWSTDFPFLLQPCLEEELEQTARAYWARQTQIQKQTSDLLHQTFPVASRLLAA